jgi:hypothetical protein
VQAGDEVRLEPGPRELSVLDMFRAKVQGKAF